MKQATTQGEVFEWVGPTDDELVAITYLDKLANTLGNPPDISTDAGLKLMDAVIGVWQKQCPQEAADWVHDRKIDLETEKSLRELTHESSFGYNPATYPPTLFQLIKVMFPDLKLNEKVVWKKLIALYPTLFKTSNYA